MPGNAWCRTMNHLTRHDYASALQLLARIEERAGDAQGFAHAVVLALHDYIAAERTTLSVCDLATGPGQVLGLQGSGLPYAIAVPLFESPQMRVHLVLNRRVRDFDERDRERLDLLRPHLAFLYRHAHGLVALPPGPAPAPWPDAGLPEPCDASCLTLREGLVMRWLACGKTNAEIAALLSISPRTVQKHLEHVYVKLGVETRTAAVMRARADRARV